jgi:hypothetical protein
VTQSCYEEASIGDEPGKYSTTEGCSADPMHLGSLQSVVAGGIASPIRGVAADYLYGMTRPEQRPGHVGEELAGRRGIRREELIDEKKSHV